MEHDRQQEAFYRDLVESSIQGNFIIQNMRVVFANNAFVKMMGYASTEEILDLADASILVAPEDRAKMIDYSLAHRQGSEAPERYEVRALRADGSLLWQEAIARPMQWDGAPALQITVVDITDRKRAEESLRESEARFRDLVEGSIQGIFVHRDFRMLFANRAMAEMLGYESPEELLKIDSVLNFVHPEERARTTGFKDARLAGKESPQRYEFRAVCKSGSTLWLENIARVVNWDGADAIQATVVDITERKQAERALHESEASLKEAQRIARIGNFERDLRGEGLTWSDQIFDIFGIAQADGPPSGEAFMAMVHPEDREQVAQAADAMMKCAGTCRIDYRITRGDGEVRNIHMEAETNVDAQGTPVSMSGTMQDMTELRLTETALSDSEESLRHAQHIVRIGNWDRDLVSGKLYWSDEMYRLFEFDRDTVPAPSIEMFMERVHPDDRERMRRAIDEALAGAGPYDLDIRLQLPGGAQRILHAQGELSRDAAGEPRRFSGVAQDVTELRQAEEEVRRLNTELEQRVERRTAELRDAQAELIKKDRLATLGQLTATVSHELRNPLGAMRTSAYVLAKSLPDGNEAALKAIDRIDRGIVRCDRIIDELLDFTRSTEIDREAVTIDDWLGAVLSELSIPGGVKLETDLRLGNLAAMIDSGRMRRAVINIVENACQAIAGQAGWEAEVSKGIVTVSTGKVNGDIEIRVADDGPGIPVDIREKIFEPLFSTKNFGVGLGLPTVRQVLKQHGGSVVLESEPGVGTLFRLAFPLEEPEEGPQPTVGNCFPAALTGC